MTHTLERATAGDLELPSPLPDEIQRLTLEWVWSFGSPATRRAYRVHLAQWLDFAAGAGIDPLTATRGDGNLWARRLEMPPRNSKPATVAAKLAAVSNWYAYLASKGAIPTSSFAATDRPRRGGTYLETACLNADEARAMVAWADADYGRAALRTSAVIRLALTVGPRVSDVPDLDVSSLETERGFRVVRLTAQNRRGRARRLPAATAAAVDRYLEDRARDAGVPVAELEGPLFATATGRRVDRRYLFGLVQRIAREAGLEQPERVTPQSLRQTTAALAEENVAPIAQLRDAIGSGTPATSDRYMRRTETIESETAQSRGRTPRSDL
ncbi:tyrosine-type recombinase/integrase [Microbispora sp. SCL1-1]|uniref:tyrosine-type recombinase/integrase n=1 Tax=unclassified Microbispora TaxID=2614687 RepID=UPI0011596059|nr:tyrosine-type recombinase/integrase [Microbispora sp. SCL1-1]NJP24479.1 tyrosine-type recombinase/integrase [Microbispora sp. CL1-1]TQS14625.1 tyrosine-type recombinase/integrase [Microbispora sp. SCL1-1]